MACNRPPINHTQLDNGAPTSGYDCGVEKTADAIYFASCGQVDADATFLRKLMGLPGKQATNPRDWKTAIESDEIAKRFKAVGLRAPSARLLDGVDIGIARKDLDNGRFLVGAGWYATLNELAPRKSGSRTFGDNHAFGAYGRIGNDRTREYDPLADGRPAPGGSRYPKGPQPIPWSTMRRVFGDVRIRTRNAAGEITSERKLGAGLFLGISVPRSKPLVGIPDPTPDPNEIDWKTELDALASDLSSAIDDLLTAANDIDAINVDVTEIQNHVLELEARVSEGS